MAAPEKGLVLTGARARLSVNGVKIGWARNVNGSERIIYEPATVLDNIQVQEQVAIGYEAELRMERIRIVGKTLKSQGFFPSLGANAAEHLSNILTNGDLVVTVEDVPSGLILATYQQAKVSGHNWSITSRGIVGEDVDFVCIRSLDESEI